MNNIENVNKVDFFVRDNEQSLYRKRRYDVPNLDEIVEGGTYEGEWKKYHVDRIVEDSYCTSVYCTRLQFLMK